MTFTQGSIVVDFELEVPSVISDQDFFDKLTVAIEEETIFADYEIDPKSLSIGDGKWVDTVGVW